MMNGKVIQDDVIDMINKSNSHNRDIINKDAAVNWIKENCMTRGQYVERMVEFAKEYIKRDAIASIRRNSHMNNCCDKKYIDQDVVDAVLVDYINFTAMKMCMDWGLYTKDLRG